MFIVESNCVNTRVCVGVRVGVCVPQYHDEGGGLGEGSDEAGETRQHHCGEFWGRSGIVNKHTDIVTVCFNLKSTSHAQGGRGEERARDRKREKIGRASCRERVSSPV